jgi:multimeric flavodoxin WrbA/putative sterol carrier protein
VKVIAFNSSPRPAARSRTALMLDALAEGMREAGAEVEIVDLKDKKIRTCTACYTCWSLTPGKCSQQDDMTLDLLPRIVAADIVVFASPLYHYHINAAMKALIERTLPAFQPFLERNGDAIYHPVRDKFPDVVLLCVAGNPDAGVFEHLSGWANYLFGKNGMQPGLRLIAEIYRTSSSIMTVTPDKLKDILDATQQAGSELVRDRKVSPQTMSRITKPVEEIDTVLELANMSWRYCIAEHVTPAGMENKNRPPRPVSIKSLIAILKMGFNREKAAGREGVLQFNLSGENAGSFHMVVMGGAIEACEGIAARSDLEVDAPFDVWADIMCGKLDGAQAMIDGKYKLRGDPSWMGIFGK